MKVAGAPGHRDRFRSGKINDEPKYLQMIRSFKDKGLRGHLGGKIKQELGLSKLGTIRYRTASGSDRPVVSSDFFNNERAGRYRSRFCNDKLLLARTTQSHFELQPQRLAHTCLCG